MITKTNKSCSLRTLVCGICGAEFQNRIAPSLIEKKKKEGKVFCCSKPCVLKNSSRVHLRGSNIKCQKCGIEFFVSPSERTRRGGRKFCSWKCQRNDPSLERGKYVSSDGYYILTTGHGGYKREHIHIAEQVYGKIPKGYVVHHINEDKLDNRPENLQVMSRADHNTLHFTRDFSKQIARYKGGEGLRSIADSLGKSRESLYSAFIRHGVITPIPRTKGASLEKDKTS